MDLVGLVFASGWASGVNAYATVVVMGLVARFSDTTIVPDALGRTDVLLVAGVMFLGEVVIDKIPGVDSAWDVVSTAIRPVVGAVLAWALTGDASAADQGLFTALGGATAAASHGVKAGIRLAVNTSPEPVSNVVVSTGEDIGVIAVVALALTHPVIALWVSALLLIAGLAIVLMAWRLIRRARERWRRTPA